MALVLDGLLGFRLPADGSLKLYEASGNGENFIALKAPTSVAADKTFVLPGTDGTTGQYLKTDGSGNLGFASLPTFPAGTIVGTSDTQTLTGKTINLASNTLTTTLAQLNTAVSDADVVSIAGTETLTNKTLTNPSINNYTEGVVAIGTVTTANTLSLTNGTVQTATLTASTACTFTMPTATAGKSFILLLKQAASIGNGTATFTGVKWNNSGAPTITATAGKMDILTFVSDGTNWYGSYSQGYTP